MLVQFHRALNWVLLLALVALLLPQSQAHAAPPVRDRRFGVVEAFRAPDQASELGAGWDRIIFWWNSIEPTKGSDWNPDFMPDYILDREKNDGREVVGLISQAPTWATGSTSPAAPPKNLDLPYNDPNNYWGQFVKRIVTRYKGRINTWIIWNEPDVWDANNPGHTWGGTVEQFYQLQKVAYQAAKSVDPNIQVTLPGLTYWWDAQFGRRQFFDRLLEVASKDPTAPANNWYFDVAVLQLYNNPKMLYDGPTTFHDIMAKYGIKKPIWINETNVVPWDDPIGPMPRDFYRATQEEQASYMIQAIAYALAAGVDRLAVYKMRDDLVLPGNELFGLVRRDGSVRPAFYAYQTAIRYFGGVTSGVATQAGDIVRIVLEKPNERITVIWTTNPKGATGRVWSLARQATVVDKYGNTSTIPSNQGVYFLPLAGATANTVPYEPNRYFIGGNPLIIIESKDPGSALMTPPGTSSTDVWVAPGTGYTVSGKWLEFIKTHGWVDNLGWPRSGVVTDPFTGQTVQYFQRAILEWHPENPDPYKIQRRLIGDIMSPGADPPADPNLMSKLPPGSYRYYPPSTNGVPTGLGHFLSNYTPDGKPLYFLDYFDSHGGLDVFGFPKEEPKFHDGLWTQRFQAAVLEYHPEYDIDGNIPGTNMPYRNFRVLLRLLGDQYMRQYQLLYE